MGRLAPRQGCHRLAKCSHRSHSPRLIEIITAPELHQLSRMTISRTKFLFSLLVNLNRYLSHACFLSKLLNLLTRSRTHKKGNFLQACLSFSCPLHSITHRIVQNQLYYRSSIHGALWKCWATASNSIICHSKSLKAEGTRQGQKAEAGKLFCSQFCNPINRLASGNR